MVLIAEHLNNIEEQVALNETAISQKADVDHEHSYELTGVLLNSGDQELTDGNLRVIDNNDIGKGFAVRRKNDDGYHTAVVRGGNNGGALFEFAVIDAEGNRTQKNYMLLSESSTTLSKPLNIAGGGTNATTAADALANLGGASQEWVTAQIQAAINATWEASY